MSKIQNSFVAPRAVNTGIVPPAMVKPSDTTAAPGVRGSDVFEGVKNFFGSVEKKVENFFTSHGKDLGFTAKDTDGDEGGPHIDTDGFVVHSQDGKTTSDATASASSTDVKYYGGKVLKNFQVENVYYGSYYNTTSGKADAAYNDGFMKQYVNNSDAKSIWNQYGVAGGTFDGSTVVNKSVRSGQTISKKTLESLVKNLAANDPEATNNKIYNIQLPPGAVLSDGSATSKQGLGGFHGSVTVNGKQVYYSAIADSKGSNGIDFTNGDARKNVTITESHEISEAVTDPDVELASDTNDYSKLGWMDLNNGEIGDMEVNDAAPGTPLSTMYGTSNGYAVQKIWSQKDGTNEVKAKTSGGVAPLPKPTPAP
jgi:hypothetical protein